MKSLGQKGQSTVEYVLLMAVVVSVALAFLNSPMVKRFVGKDSQLMQKLYIQMSYSYRHGRMGEVDGSDYSREHETYYDKEKGESRFFAPTSKYPE